MKAQVSGYAAVSDETLIRLSRDGDRAAFAQLWQRHAAAGLGCARMLIPATSTADPDDLVSEAYLLIFRQVTAGKGPRGPFRPYLYATIRHLAIRWQSSLRHVTVDFSDFGDPETFGDDALGSFERAITTRAFLSLPARWQSVLWYTVVEQMQPRDVAGILGISPNSVAALAHRAREGLRSAWLQAHVADAAKGECAWVRSRLGSHLLNSLTPRRSARIRDHVADCAECRVVAGELKDVSSSLAGCLIPLVLGASVGGAWLAKATSGAGAGMAAPSAAAALPALPTATASGSGTVAAGLSTTTTSALVGASALASAVFSMSIAGGGISDPPAAAETPPPAAHATTETASGWSPNLTHERRTPDRDNVSVSVPAQRQQTATTDAAAPAPSPDPTTVPTPAPTPTPTPEPTASAPPPLLHGDLPSVDLDVPDVASVHTHVTLNGIGLPGATVQVSAAGTVYGSVVVGKDGSWSISLDGPPGGFAHLEVSQTASGLLGTLLGLVPVVVDTVIPGLPIDILG